MDTLSLYLHICSLSQYISLIYLVVMKTLLLETRESLSYMLCIDLREQKLIALGHEIIAAISVGVVNCYMSEC